MSKLNWLSRTEVLIGEENITKLQNANVLIIGLGGVGSFAAEAIARSGINKITIVDGDIVDETNRNRQLVAFTSTENIPKVEVMKHRLLDINPSIELTYINEFLTDTRIKELITTDFSYVMDCIDSISPKISIIKTCYERRIKFISSMGAGGKMDPTKVRVSSLKNSKHCMLSKTIKKRLKKIGIKRGVTIVYSIESLRKDTMMLTDGSDYKRSFYGTNSYLPAVFGLTVASVVIRDLIGEKYKS